MSAEQMTLRATLEGHGNWVTQIATTPQYPDMILSASRGKHSDKCSSFVFSLLSQKHTPIYILR